MKKVLITLLLLFGIQVMNAQKFEIGVYGGASNFIGDVGSTQYINPNSLALGGVAKWNISNRYSYRGSLIYTKLRANDNDSNMPARQVRGYEFACKMLEGSLGMEFNFLEFDLEDFDNPITPYIYGGISGIGYDKLYFDNGTVRDYGNHITFAVPMALGIKAKVAYKLVAAFEIGARYTFADDLDGSNPAKLPGGLDETQYRFGNTNSNDWYVFTGVSLTYTFGRKPCYSCF